MKTLKLKIGDRSGIIRLMNEVYSRGGLDLSGVALAQKTITKIKISDSEFKKIGAKEITPGQYQWTEKQDVEQSFEFGDDEIKMIQGAIDKKEIAAGFGLADTYAIKLKEQLK